MGTRRLESVGTRWEKENHYRYRCRVRLMKLTFRSLHMACEALSATSAEDRGGLEVGSSWTVDVGTRNDLHDAAWGSP